MMSLKANLGFAFMLLVGVAFVSYIHLTWHAQKAFSRYFESPPENGSSYDFVVVGSGSAGSVVAGRLAESGNSVLLLEAGGPSHWLQGIAAFVGMFMISPYDWGYSLRQENAGLALKDKVMLYPRGKVLGGTSMLNWMLYVRGHSADYDEWESLGNPGWGYEDVLPYFKKSEDFSGEVDDKERYHGTGGPIGVGPAVHSWPVADIFLEAMKELGYPLGDVNGKLEDTGFFDSVQTFQKGGWRLGTYRSFVEPLLGKASIDVVTYAHVDKILLEGGGSKATGVSGRRFGERFAFKARKEVVVSAGAIGSPKVLMLSGIGPKKHLAEVGITAIKDLPVGENLQVQKSSPY